MLFGKLVNTVARKKIVFVIVEGPSDDEALGVMLEKIYDKNRVHIHITHGDITTQSSVKNIISEIGNVVKEFSKSYHLTKIHFKEIIHIVDMDGAFIPESAVFEDVSAEKTIYDLSQIKTKDAEAIRKRNKAKSLCLSRMSETETIWNIPYQAYYMSCNLDHVLYDKLNLNDNEKEEYAHRFAKLYKNNVDKFIKFITESPFSVSDDYRKSWEFIIEGLHSLERHTNLGICLKKAQTARS